MPIVKICQGQPELRVALETPGCQGSRLADADSIRLRLFAPPLKCALKSPIINIGCRLPGSVPPQPWGWDTTCVPHELGTLVYPAWEVSPEGEITFRFDDLLWSLPQGRYIGVVEFNDGGTIAELDIDLCGERFVIDSVTTRSPDCF